MARRCMHPPLKDQADGRKAPTSCCNDPMRVAELL
jgi:hypothetical protein